MPVSNPDAEDNEQKNEKKKEKAKGNHRFLIPSLSKAKKRIVSKKITRKPSSPSSSSSSSSGLWKKVCFCGIDTSRTNTLEWSSSSNPDLKGENFTLRVLLQTNDFFSKDSNPHLSFTESQTEDHEIIAVRYASNTVDCSKKRLVMRMSTR